jgi:predicted NBD/HSP70 family sugar kinase
MRMKNDANCRALSQAVDGAAANAHVGEILGTGVGEGEGIVVNRQIRSRHPKIAVQQNLLVLIYTGPEHGIA